MSSEDAHTDFRVESSERLSRLEANQQNISDRIEDVYDGQDEILDRLDDRWETIDDKAGEEQLDDVEEQTMENAKKLARYEAGFKLVATSAALFASGSAYILYFA